MPMPNPQHDHRIVFAQVIDDQVRFVVVGAHWRIDLLAQPCSTGIVSEKFERGGQSVVIFVRLSKAEQQQSFYEDRLDVS